MGMSNSISAPASSPLLTQVLALFPAPALLLDRGLIRSANRLAEALIGRASGDLVGRVLDEVLGTSGRAIDAECNSIDDRFAIATLRDRTSMRAIEEALREEEDRLAQIVRAAPGVPYSFRLRPDGSTSIPYASFGIEPLLGHSREVLAESASVIWESMDEADARRVREAMLASARDMSMYAGEIRVRVGNEYRWIALRALPTREPDGSILWHGFAMDRTAERNAIEAAKAAEARFAQAFQLSPVGLVLTAVSTMTVLEVNDAYLKIWGLPREKVVGSVINTLPAQPSATDHMKLSEALTRDREIRDYEYEYVRDDGGVGHAMISVTLMELKGELYTLTMMSDVTERRRSEAERSALEERLRQAQKLDSIGRLAGGIAHDFNNWLTVVSGCTEELGTGEATGEARNALLSETRHAIERAASLTRDLLAFSRQEVLDPKVVDLNEVITTSVRMLQRVLGEDITLVMDLERTLPQVKIDRNHWSSVLMNLCVNARDAMPKGGKITIRTRTGTGRDAGHVVCDVADEGVGFGPEVRERIFEPFFTTKDQQGTGLGLSVVHGIVEQSGGRIDVNSTPGVGTTFSIALPAVRVATTPTSAAPAAIRKGAETILIAEDEDLVRRLAARVLRASGYTVLEAANGAEALEVLDRSPSVDLLFTDLVMPGMTGRELAEEVMRLRPGIAVLYTTGYTQDAVVRVGIQRSEVAFLQKPFTPQTLVAAVQAALDEHRNEAHAS